MSDKISKSKIVPGISIKNALKKINETGFAILFVCDEDGVLIGSLTDGDIRRWILKTGDLQAEIASCFNSSPTFLVEGSYTRDDVKKLMLEKTLEAIPVVDDKRNILDILWWADMFGDNNVLYKKVNIPVVIMAGGKGERLGPFTNIFPKPLMPIGDKPIIEIIIERFRRHKVDIFYIILNYKGKMIESYLNNNDRKPYKIRYVWEKKFLGTAGGLKLISPRPDGDFIVSNSDIVVDIDYDDLVNFHNKNNYILTVIGSMQCHKIPYGVIHFGKDGKIDKIQEKPEFDIMINTGVYVLSKKALDFIPKNRYFDMTDLMQALLAKGQHIGVYPASEKSYIDIGQWEEYKKAMEKIQSLK